MNYILKTFVCFAAMFFMLSFCFAQNLPCDKKCNQDPQSKCDVVLKTDIAETKPVTDITKRFNDLADCCCCEGKYNEIADFLKSLLAKKQLAAAPLHYYAALTRYYQLAYLEKSQAWDEYFNQGSAYREELTANAFAAVKATAVYDPVHIYSRLLLWQYYSAQEDVSSMDALIALMQSTTEYAKSALDLEPVKLSADKLLASGEKARARELYRIYISRVTGGEVKNEDLAKLADGFYKEGNLDLSEEVYDAYVQRLNKEGNKEALASVLKNIAKSFSYNDTSMSDSEYAEKMFAKLEAAAGPQAFDEELLYIRAWNLEKGKLWKQAREMYIELLKRFPQTPHADEALYKIGLISAYALRDKEGAKEYFQKLANKEIVSPQVISAMYQLGLLSQWQEESAKAKDYYAKALTLAAGLYKETIALVNARQQELSGNLPIELNLKTFLDASLKPENNRFDMTKVGLRYGPSKVKVEEEVDISSSAVSYTAGCMQVIMEYHWSGNTGSTKPGLDKVGFKTTYSEPGTKEVFIVLISPPDIIDRDFSMVDVR